MADKAARKVKTRSPEHPAISLQEAIRRADEFYSHEALNYAPVDVAKKHWGYGPLSSSGMRVLAALLHYGLLEEHGANKDRRVRLSKLARAILLDRREDTTEKDEALRAAALRPAIYSVLWKQWGPHLPSDASMEFDLLNKHNFNPASVRSFIKDFKATIAFARLAESGGIVDKADEELAPEEPAFTAKEDAGSNPARNTGLQSLAIPVARTEGGPQIPLNVVIPLSAGRRAILSMPPTVSMAEYQLIRKAVADNLEMYKVMIVTDLPTGADDRSGREAG